MPSMHHMQRHIITKHYNAVEVQSCTKWKRLHWLAENVHKPVTGQKMQWNQAQHSESTLALLSHSPGEKQTSSQDGSVDDLTQNPSCFTCKREFTSRARPVQCQHCGNLSHRQFNCSDLARGEADTKWNCGNHGTPDNTSVETAGSMNSGNPSDLKNHTP